VLHFLIRGVFGKAQLTKAPGLNFGLLVTVWAPQMGVWRAADTTLARYSQYLWMLKQYVENQI